MSHIENIEKMQDCVAEKLKAYLDDFENADTHEVEKVADVLKDLSEALYYSKVTKAMKDAEEEDELAMKMAMSDSNSDNREFYGGRRYYTRPRYRMDDYDYRMPDRMYYTDYSSTYSNRYGMSNGRQGTSMSRYDTARRNYTETRAVHRGNTDEDNQAKMRELENYLEELSSDVTDLISEMSPDEKSMMRNKITMLANKIM